MPRTILLADDSLTIRKVVELTFGDTDIRVETVGSGREAIERLDVLRPDLVLADVVMPGPSGYDVCRAVKSSGRPVPVLLLAGTFEAFDPEEARACGADGHMTKPFDSKTLVEWVQRLLHRPAAAVPDTPLAGASIAGTTEVDEDLEAMFEDLAAPDPADTLDAPETPADSGVVEIAWTPIPVETKPSRKRPPDPAAADATSLTPADIDAIAQAVVARLSERILREIAWDVVPDLAEVIVRERLRELEREP